MEMGISFQWVCGTGKMAHGWRNREERERREQRAESKEEDAKSAED